MRELRAKDYAIVEHTAAESAPAPTANATDLISVLWRRKYFIAAILVLSVALGFWFAKSQTPRYTATSTVKLDVYQRGIADIESVVTGMSGDTREVRSQLQVIRSRSLLGRVVDGQNLTEDPEFNPTLQPPRVASWSNPLTWPEKLGLASPPEPVRSTLPDEEVRERAIDALLRRTNVLPVHFSFVFHISVQTTDREKSAVIANAIADQYILNQIEVKYRATEQATSWLSNRVAELKESLERAEAAVADHRASAGLVNEEAVDAIAARIVSLKSTRSEIADARARAETRLERLRTLKEQGDYAAIAAETGSIRLENLAGTLAAGPNSAAQTRFDSELLAVTNRLERELRQSDTNLAKLTSDIAEFEARQNSQADDLVMLRQLQREAQAASLIYETFLSRLKETSVQQGIHKADAILISEARVPLSRSYPRYRVILATAFFIGLFVAGALVVLLETVDQTFSVPEELERFTGLPLLGLIPVAPITARNNILKFVINRPTSPFVEAVRNLRTSIQLSGVDQLNKVVAIASATEGEGKTSLSVSLAHTSATLSNRKVLVLDCDLRRRRLSAALGGKGLPGLIAYFGGNAGIDEIIHRHETGGFDVIYADKSPKITADIFASNKFSDLIAEARERYDLILIDTPPVLALTDVRVIATQVDLVLFSITWKRTRKKLVRTALNVLTQNSPKKIALVFNRMNIQKSIGYYGSYYYNR